MAIGSFFRKMFGGSDKRAEPPSPPARAHDPLDEPRRRARTASRREDPAGWAEAQQLLARDLIYEAHVRGQPYASDFYREAQEILAEAIAGIDGAGHHPLFGASLYRLRGEAKFRSADLLTDVDAKGRALADAVNDFGAALDIATLADSHGVWLDAQLFRGAAFEELSRLKSGDEALGWLDEAAACFEAVATQATPGTINPIGAFNRAVVLDLRAARTDPAQALPYYETARVSLLQAMANSQFAESQTGLAQRLAALDQMIANLR